MDIDLRIISQLESLFNNDKDCRIGSINAVAFVVQSALPSLNTATKYIFNSIQKLFGKDIANNFIIVATFADAGEIQAMSALKDGNIPTNFVSKLNNSVLFAKFSGSDGLINKMFWDVGQAGYKSIFNYVSKMSPKSLLLKQNLIEERKKLCETIELLDKKIREEIDTINLIEQEYRVIEQMKTNVHVTRNFTYTTTEIQVKKEDLPKGIYATNCASCNKTCHDNCAYSDDDDKINCCAIKNDGYCYICGCHWTSHHNMPFKWTPYQIQVTKKYEELEKKYGDAKNKIQSSKNMLANVENKYKQIWEKPSNYLSNFKHCLDRLHQIALRPNTLSEIDHIQIRIDSETHNAQPGWQKRVKWLNEFLEQQRLIENITKKKDITPQQISQIKTNRILDFLKKEINI